MVQGGRVSTNHINLMACRVGQYRLYKVETKMQQNAVQGIGHDPIIQVYRRYRDFEWLH